MACVVVLMGTTDGVPLFDDKKRGTWPFVYKCLNLPDGLANLMTNVHVAMLAPSEQLDLDTATVPHQIRRTVSYPQSFYPHTSILVDELLAAYSRGITVYDASIPRHQIRLRHFACKVMLLCWTGDQPAQSLLSGRQKNACHWCRYKGDHRPEITRSCYGGFRRFLGMILFFVYAFH